MVLTKDAILSADDLPRESVDVPEWGGDVLVRTMTGTERDAFEQAVIDGRTGKATNMQNIRARLCALCVVDEKGQRLFDDKDVAELGRKSSKALDRVFEVAQQLNGLREADIDELSGN